MTQSEAPKTFLLRLPLPMMARLRERARDNDRSVAGEIRLAIRFYLANPDTVTNYINSERNPANED